MTVNKSERVEEIKALSNIIWNLCEEYKVCLLPHELKDGTRTIIVQDNTNGKKYALVREK